jgi:hypothetical protein
MAARFPGSAQGTVHRLDQPPVQTAARRGAQRPEALLGITLRPQLAVIAASMGEAVLSVGGWVFDQTLGGWDAVILTADHANVRAALILGARACSLEAALADTTPNAGLKTVAVQAELYGRDPRVRRMVLDLLHASQAEVRFWGDLPLTELEGTARPERHLPSLAAQAFKAQAITALPVLSAPAAGAGLSQGAETFCRARMLGRALVTA